MPLIRVYAQTDAARTVASSRRNPRQRNNFNLHDALDDPIQRFVNVFQPSSYVRPHRHDPAAFELFALLEGRLAVVLFEDDGTLLETAILEAVGARVAEIPSGTWHTAFALVHDTTVFEVKPGPYRPPGDKDFAPWAPADGTAEARQMLAAWRDLVVAGGSS